MLSSKNKLLITVLLALVAVVCGVSAFFAYKGQRKDAVDQYVTPKQPQKSLDRKISEGYPWGHDLNSIAAASVGEPIYLGDYVHLGPFTKEGEAQVIQLADSMESSVSAGGTLLVKGFLYNPEAYPLVDLQLFGVLYEENGKKDAKAEVKSDFLILSGFNLDSKERKEFRYELKLPTELRNKKHSVALGLNQGKVWSFGINPYYGRINKYWHNTKSIATFDVKGGSDNQLWVDRDTVTVENMGNKFFATGKETIISSPEIKVNFDLVNDTEESKDVTIVYNLVNLAGEQFSEYEYPEWSNVVYREKITANGKERNTVDRPLNLDELQQRAREFEQEKGLSWKENSRSFSTLKIEVITDGGKSVVYAPLFLEYQGYVACPLFPEITQFPVRKGEKFDIVAGFYDYRQAVFDFRDGRVQIGDDRYMNEPKKIGEVKNVGKIEVVLYDRKEEEIGRLYYDGPFDGHKKGWKSNVQAQDDLNYIKMVGKIYGENGIINKTFERIYDCEKIGEGTCIQQGQDKQKQVYLTVILLVLAIGLGLLVAYQVGRRIMTKKNEQ